MKYNRNLSLGQNAMKGVDIAESDEIFTPDNTEWQTETNEYGITESHLVYVGSMEELAEETGKTEDELYELLGKYEDESLDLMESQREADEARKGK